MNLNLIVGVNLLSYLSDMVYPYTRFRARSELADSDIEPSDAAPSAATSSLPPSIFVGPNVVAAEGPESVSTELAGPVSAPTHSLPAGGPPSSGSHGMSGSAGPSHVGVSALGYPSGLAGPPDSSAYGGGQMSSSLAIGIARAESSSKFESSSTSSRQPPVTAAAARLRRKVIHKTLRWPHVYLHLYLHV